MSETLLFVGNPNSGKTTLFNYFTGSRYKTVNYPGATVDFALAEWKTPTQSHWVLDTPGIVSIVPQSEDEEITRRALENIVPFVPNATQKMPALLIGVVDAMQLSRHLVLIRQLQQCGYAMVLAVTMTDVAHKHGRKIDFLTLSELLNMPVIPIEGRTGKGIDKLKQACCIRLAQKGSLPQPCPSHIEASTLKEQFEWAEKMVGLVSSNGYEKISGFDIDAWLLHPVFGPVGFMVTMGLFFTCIFAVASPAMAGIDSGFTWGIASLSAFLPAVWWADLLTKGILTGVGSVFVFVPQIALLFFLLGVMEGSGYLARGAMLADRPLSAIGLNGRSFVPLLSGCACAIPAMMAARTLPGKKEKLLTLFMIPLMTCSARLPVYGLLLSLLIGFHHPVQIAIGMTGIYVSSIILASSVTAIVGRMLRVAPAPGFQIELPRWHWPVLRHVLTHTVTQTFSFIKKAGPVIVCVGVLLWVLSTFPSPTHSFLHTFGHVLSPLLSPMGLDWRVGVALILAFAAREVFVSAIALMFASESTHLASLVNTLHHAVLEGTTQPLFTPASIIGLIVFFMISMQCASTLAIAKKEMGGWKLPLAMTVSYIVGAYIAAVGVVQAVQFWMG